MTGTTNPAGLNNPVLIANGGSSAATAAAAMDALSPLSVKGDLIGYSSANIRLAAGTNGLALVADSTAATGIVWAPAPNVTSVGLSSTTLTVVGSPITTSGTMTIDLPLSVAGNNMLLNASMELMMRFASQNTGVTGTITNTTVYSLDRWQCKTGASAAVIVKQIAGATSGSWVAQIQRTSGNTNTGVIYFAQSLTRDMCIGAAGNKITIGFWAKCGANYSPTSSLLTVTVYSGVGVTDISGIAGAFSGSASAISTTVTLTTTLQFFTVTSASALGSTVTQLCAEFSMTPVGTASTNDHFSVTDVSLEISPQFTQFQRKTAPQVYSECARFYQKTFDSTVLPVSNANNQPVQWSASQTGALSDPSSTFTFLITMFKAPTIVTYNTRAAGAQVRDTTAAADCSAISTIATPQGVFITCTGNAGTAVGNALQVSFTADAEIT